MTMSGSSLMPLPALGALAIGTALLLAVAPAHAESADDSRLRQIAGQAQSYTGEVRELLAKGADPNAPGQGGRTALHGAARIAAAETMQALLEAGGNPNRRDEDGNTPLHFAADSAARAMSIGGEVDTIRVLLRAGGNPNRANARGRTPLHVAASSPHGEGAVRALVSGGADADRKDRSGDTPLHAAVGPNLGQPGVVRTLLNGGGDASARNGDGLTVLQLFVRVAPDQGDTAALLIDAGADPDRKYPNGDAPLHAAIRSGGNRGKVDVAEALLSGGADPCVRDAKRYTPYQVAREGGAIHRALDRAGGHDFACDGSGVQITEVDRVMRAAKRSNVRSGPGTEHDKVGLLEVGDEVRVTGEAGDWLRIETPRGEAFVHASLLEAQVTLEPRCEGRQEGAKCWKELADRPGCHVWDSYLQLDQTVTWSGACQGGLAIGQGTLDWIASDWSVEETGALDRGKHRGEWAASFDSGTVAEGTYVGGELNGRWVFRYPGGTVEEGPYVDSERHGRWIERFKDGGRLEQEWRNGSREGQPGVYVTSDGNRHPGRWSDGCFVDDDGNPRVKLNSKTWEECTSQ